MLKTTILVIDCLMLVHYHMNNVKGDSWLFLKTNNIKLDNFL